MGKILRCRECGKVYRDLEELEDLRDNDSVCLVCNSTIEVPDWDRLLASYEDDETDGDADDIDDDDWDDEVDGDDDDADDVDDSIDDDDFDDIDEDEDEDDADEEEDRDS